MIYWHNKIQYLANSNIDSGNYVPMKYMNFTVLAVSCHTVNMGIGVDGLFALLNTKIRAVNNYLSFNNQPIAHHIALHLFTQMRYIEAETKWLLFFRRHFQMYFLECKRIGVLIKISLKFVAKGPINNIPALVQIMAWRRPGDKPLSEPMLVSLLTHARPQRVN